MFEDELKGLPTCLEVTNKYCEMYKFPGKLVFDGTYVKVKGYKKQIPLIWGVDYDTHDFPHSMLVPSENYQACRKYFSDLKTINYTLRYLVCDGNINIKVAAKDIYPNVIIQTCWKHFLENIRNDLGTKTSDRYLNFVEDVEKIYSKRLAIWELIEYVIKIYPKYKEDHRTLEWLNQIMIMREELTNYHNFVDVPNTTNMIEGFNGHLKDRLAGIRGFKSFNSAKYFLNAYVLNRRITKFNSCSKKFKHLNGKTPIDQTIKFTEEMPNIFN